MHLLPEWYEDCVGVWCLYLHTFVCTDKHGTLRHLEIAPKDEPIYLFIFAEDMFDFC